MLLLYHMLHTAKVAYELKQSILMPFSNLLAMSGTAVLHCDDDVLPPDACTICRYDRSLLLFQLCS